ncbi:unnamed protein product [Vitrella brassicaformis CCMP3155]|uniref:Uncharacterized protein n=1 Tax=Vitrella brassicaformis (strain CCMP3155) TaxID=1169540 RepID=A0A0G4EXF4_VITBC|nr:unnamed protein product [Vitrella brassicaformis CCMP3155]|eukprot:CEM03371.1 unnamed protein product [Vitrella brassicaformis CCMP3155]
MNVRLRARRSAAPQSSWPSTAAKQQIDAMRAAKGGLQKKRAAIREREQRMRERQVDTRGDMMTLWSSLSTFYITEDFYHCAHAQLAPQEPLLLFWPPANGRFIL